MLETVNKESNYLCKVVVLKNVRMHSNAHSLQCVSVGLNTVITGMDAKEGDIYVYFPLESKISADFLAFTNSFRDPSANSDITKKGYFEDNCRVKAMRLRGEQSMGYIVPFRTIAEWSGKNELDYIDGLEFDTINGKLIVEKYVSFKKQRADARQGKQPKLTRLVDGQVNLHVQTKNLRHVPEAITPNDLISITYKTHGTSWWVSNVLVKNKLNWFARLGQKLGLNVRATDYDLVYGSRKVVKNKSFEDPKGQDHFFGYDLWEDIKNEIGDLIPKGWTLYGEMLGYDKNGGAIQKGFDYGCDPQGGNFGVNHTHAIKSFKPQSKIEVYRITQTNSDGVVTELTYPQIKEFCDSVGLTAPHLYFYGRAGDFYNTDYGTSLEKWQENFVIKLQDTFNEKDCFMCVNKVPEEGIVIRKEKLIGCEAYKLKSFRFLEKETKLLDKGESDIESEN